MNFKIINVLTLLLLCTLVISHTAFAADLFVSKWADYSQKLRSCSPGAFQLPNSNSNISSLMINAFNRNNMTGNKNRLYITNEIIGWRDNKCIVNQTSYTQDESATKVVIHCAYAKIDLSSMADNAKDVSMRTSNVSKDNSASAIVNKSCIIESSYSP